MEGLLIQLFAFFIVFRMYKAEGVDRLAWFMFGILFISDNFVMFQAYPTTSSRFFIFFLFLIQLVKSKFWVKVKYFPLKASISLILIGFLIIALFDSRLNLNLVKILNRSLGYFFDNFFVMVLTFMLVRDINDFIKIYRIILFFFLAFGVYGFYNYVTGNNFYSAFVSHAFGFVDYAEVYTSGHDGRYRITSFTWHPIYYGFLLTIAILMNIFLLGNLSFKKTNKNLFIAILLISLINLFMVNSRTPFFAFLGGVAVYFIWGLELGKKIQIAFITIFVMNLAITFIPQVNEFVSNSFDTFSSRGSKLEGSSVELRNYQLASSVLIFNKSPITGNGFSYIEENLGFKGKVEDRASDSSFAGFESYLYKLLIEQGIVGMVTQLIFSIALILYLIRNYLLAKSSFAKRLAILTLGMFLSFLLFIFGTGDLGTFKVFMAILGINIKGLEYFKYADRKKDDFQSEKLIPV